MRMRVKDTRHHHHLLSQGTCLVDDCFRPRPHDSLRLNNKDTEKERDFFFSSDSRRCIHLTPISKSIDCNEVIRLCPAKPNCIVLRVKCDAKSQSKSCDNRHGQQPGQESRNRFRNNMDRVTSGGTNRNRCQSQKLTR